MIHDLQWFLDRVGKYIWGPLGRWQITTQAEAKRLFKQQDRNNLFKDL
jgi:hypothetical protein